MRRAELPFRLRSPLAAAVLVALLPAPAIAQLRWEHRVVVPTTARDTELEVEGSLERNVNRLAALGFEVTALAGGDGGLLDALLDRRPYSAGLADHTGQVFVVMARPAGGPDPPREYRLLHARTHVGVGEIVAAHGRDGFRLVRFSHEGSHFHAAFERTGDEAARRDYAVLANRGRKSWMAQIAEDPAVASRLTRVVPMALESALVELGPAVAPPAALEWLSEPFHQRSRQQDRLRERAREGFRVQLVRRRGSELDLLLVRPAGTEGPAPRPSLEDAPWGGPCGRGAMAGADVLPDGDVACVVEEEAGVANRGFDLVARAEPELGGRLLVGTPDCALRLRAGGSGPAWARIARARMLEAEIAARVEPGFRVTRLLAARPESGEGRLVVFATDDPALRSSAAVAALSPAAPLAPEHDEPGGDLRAARAAELDAALAAAPGLAGASLWLEIDDRPKRGRARLAGCVASRAQKEEAERVARSLLAASAYAGFELRSEVRVEW
ncbi:MAG: hypothetical protein M5U13_17350 [Thermoanaerobaculia bacterium]|nr:hypothetical protein [Thermoanaerobaculia bacterium]